jgi:hypothetical protein
VPRGTRLPTEHASSHQRLTAFGTHGPNAGWTKTLTATRTATRGSLTLVAVAEKLRMTPLNLLRMTPLNLMRGPIRMWLATDHSKRLGSDRTSVNDHLP